MSGVAELIDLFQIHDKFDLQVLLDKLVESNRVKEIYTLMRSTSKST